MGRPHLINLDNLFNKQQRINYHNTFVCIHIFMNIIWTWKTTMTFALVYIVYPYRPINTHLKGIQHTVMTQIYIYKNQLFILNKVDIYRMFEYLVREIYCRHHNNTSFCMSNIHFDMVRTIKCQT